MRPRWADSTPFAVPSRACAAVMAGLLVTACGSAVTDDEDGTGTEAGEGFPVTVEDNCGETTTFDQPPSSAVTLTSNATELMLELGLTDHMSGAAYQRDRPIGAQYEEDYESVPVLADDLPSLEVLLDAEPDFVYSGYPDGFSESSGYTRDRLHELSIDTHLNPEGCTTEPVSFDLLFEEVRTIGDIFGVPDEAESSVTDIEERLDAVRDGIEGVEPVDVFVYNTGEDAPSTTGGFSMLTHMIEEAGGRNIFADEEERWMQVSWEQVADREPDVILIYDHVEPSQEEKEDTLTSTPAIEDLTAVQQERFPVVSLSLAQPGPRSVEGVEELAEQFHPQAFDE